MEEAEQAAGQDTLVERRWFVAMNVELDKLSQVEQGPSDKVGEALPDLRLPSSVIDLISPVLSELHLELFVETSIDRKEAPIHHGIRNEHGKRILIHLPTEVF